MLPTSLAIAWPLWRRHRWGLLVTMIYLVFAAAMVAVLTPGAFHPKFVNGALGLITTLLIGPAAYLVPIFCLGFEADVNARESCFPSALFRLPVRTASLVGWPMAYGAAAAALIWLVTASFVLGPWLRLWDLTVPLWWPAALAVASMAWFQAVLWVPFGLPLVRIALAGILIPGLIALAERGVSSGASEAFLTAMFACLAAVGWMVGFVGVKHARRGDLPEWALLVRPWRYLARRWPRRRQPFADAGRAQVWFEWRRNGRMLPVLTALLLPFVLFPLILGPNDTIPAYRIVLGSLLVPVFFAGLAATVVSGNHPWVKDYYGLTPSTATLPLSTAALVAAKLKAAAWSTLATWTLMILVVSLALALTGNLNAIRVSWQQLPGIQQPAEIVATILASGIFLLAWTWKRMVDSVAVGLTGGKWLIQGTLYVSITTFFALIFIGNMIYSKPEMRHFLFWVPWILGFWILCRLLATGWMIRQVLRQKLVERGTLLVWFFAWLLLATLLFGVFAWVMPRELVPLHYLGLAVLLVMPMTRLAATPLALAWNRHQ